EDDRRWVPRRFRRRRACGRRGTVRRSAPGSGGPRRRAVRASASEQAPAVRSESVGEELRPGPEGPLDQSSGRRPDDPQGHPPEARAEPEGPRPRQQDDGRRGGQEGKSRQGRRLVAQIVPALRRPRGARQGRAVDRGRALTPPTRRALLAGVLGVAAFASTLSAGFVAGLLAAVLAPGAEAVQAVVGRADLLQALFCVLGLWLHRRGSLLAAAAFFCSLLSKESAVMAPFAYAAFDALTPAERRTPWAAYVVAAAAYAGLRYAVAGPMSPVVQAQMNPLVMAPLLESILGAGRVLLERYAWGIVDAFRRLYDCSARECGPAPVSDALAWGGLALALALGAAPIILRKRQPQVAAGLAWFVLFFLPVSNLLLRGPTLYGERLLYVPL